MSCDRVYCRGDKNPDYDCLANFKCDCLCHVEKLKMPLDELLDIRHDLTMRKFMGGPISPAETEVLDVINAWLTRLLPPAVGLPPDILEAMQEVKILRAERANPTMTREEVVEFLKGK